MFPFFQIDVIATTNPSFFLSAELQGFKLGEFLEVGNSYNSDTGKIEGNATFLIDYTTVPFELIVDIEGAIGIPALKTYGEVDIGIDDSGASIEGEIFIFDGVLNPYVTIRYVLGNFHPLGWHRREIICFFLSCVLLDGIGTSRISMQS